MINETEEIQMTNKNNRTLYTSKLNEEYASPARFEYEKGKAAKSTRSFPHS